jgi:hypothetical protein
VDNNIVTPLIQRPKIIHRKKIIVAKILRDCSTPHANIIKSKGIDII